MQCRGRENHIIINDVNSFCAAVVLEGKVERYCNSSNVLVRCPFCASRGGDLHCRGREKDASDLFLIHTAILPVIMP